MNTSERAILCVLLISIPVAYFAGRHQQYQQDLETVQSDLEAQQLCIDVAIQKLKR